MKKEVIAGRWVYLLLCLIAIVNTIWLATTRVDLLIDIPVAARILGPALLFSALLLITSRILAARDRASRPLVIADAIFQSLLFLQLCWLNLRLLNHLTMSLSLPFVDDRLIAWDKAFGFNWLAYFQWVHDRPLVSEVLDLAYTSLTPFSVAALVMLILIGHLRRARFFLETFFVTAIISIVIGCLAPAEAAVVRLIEDMAEFPNFEAAPGTYHMAHFEHLRAQEGPILLSLMHLPGLVTIPSFHTAAGVLAAVAFWGTLLRWPVMIYTAIMIAATPIFGSHYFVDLIAGAAVALAVIAVVIRHPRYAKLRTTSRAPRRRKPTETASTSDLVR